MYDLIIVGGGPAGVAAGVYAARKLLKTLLITDTFGGQSVVSEDIQNWIGTVHISGEDLAKSLKGHLMEYVGEHVDVKEGVRATNVERTDAGFAVTTSTGEQFETRTVLIASGAERRKLLVPGADILEHKGLTYCASCDGPLFSGMDVAVIGGGNAAFETAAQLLAYTKSVTLLNRGADFRADPITVKKVLENPHMTSLTNVDVVRIEGEKFVSGLMYKNSATGEETSLPVQGIFVEIGLLPATEYVKNLVDVDSVGRVIVNPKDQRTSVLGVWAAGDCTDELYHQNNIAVGDAVKALEDIYVFLKAR
jgi:alkyl hydroperoxide reductase subunit F